MPADGTEDDVATAALLLNCAGVQRHLFPKTYHIVVSKGFIAYLLFLTVFVFLPCKLQIAWKFAVVLHLHLHHSDASAAQDSEGKRQVAHRLLLTRVVPIESLIEIRIIRRRKCCDRQGRLCLYPSKCFWGYPTNFERNIIVVTDSCCNNYFFCVHEMEEFMADNWPAPNDLEDATDQKRKAKLRWSTQCTRPCSSRQSLTRLCELRQTEAAFAPTLKAAFQKVLSAAGSSPLRRDASDAQARKDVSLLK
eukprot:s35_g44.t1